MAQLLQWAPEIFYSLCGLVSINAAVRALKNSKAKYGTFLFWLILGIIFIFGKIIPYVMTGVLLILMGLLTVTNQVRMGEFEDIDETKKKEASERVKNKIFIPAALIGVMALLMSFVRIDGKPLDGATMIGVACLVSLISAFIICKPKVKETREDTARLLMQVGAACLLPQLLGALGAVFTKAGVGEVIASIISSIFPTGNIVIGVLLYCLGMVVFTMIMGNGFAAFSVITVGIGVPFVIMQGGDPVVVATLGMTSGFCGTLLTPMAANFNIVPCAVLETKDKWTVIKAQIPMAIILIIIHVVLMLTLAF
ncbi:MAG: DUF979 domain-containing protein [Beduini sp.]|uniref:DUF979 domain-containing protein n=1 Tax=Beduini sp. TaxID=1922300 RepID=UPI0039A3B1E2